MSSSASVATRGLLFIVSAPSGTGKTTLVERLVQDRCPNLRLSRSYTSRSARAGEHDGVDYNFISRERFEAMIADRVVPRIRGRVRQLLRHRRRRHRGAAGRAARTWCWSSTSRAPGRCAAAASRRSGSSCCRPRPRSSNSACAAAARTARSRSAAVSTWRSREVGDFATYEYVVVNDELDGAVDRLRAIVLAERAKRADACGRPRKRSSRASASRSASVE